MMVAASHIWHLFARLRLYSLMRSFAARSADELDLLRNLTGHSDAVHAWQRAPNQ